MSALVLSLATTVLALIWLGPLLTIWRGSITAHMLAHMGVVAIAAPLLAIGLAQRLPRTKAPMLVGMPLVASLVELVVVWGWHAPAARRFAQGTLVGTVSEQASFLAAGLFLWLSCLAAAGGGKASRASGAFGLLLTTIHMTLLGALLALSPRPLYASGEVTCFGVTLSAAQDQQLGAVVMLLLGAATYLAGGIGLLAGLFCNTDRRAA